MVKKKLIEIDLLKKETVKDEVKEIEETKDIKKIKKPPTEKQLAARKKLKESREEKLANERNEKAMLEKEILEKKVAIEIKKK